MQISGVVPELRLQLLLLLLLWGCKLLLRQNCDQPPQQQLYLEAMQAVISDACMLQQSRLCKTLHCDRR